MKRECECKANNWAIVAQIVDEDINEVFLCCNNCNKKYVISCDYDYKGLKPYDFDNYCGIKDPYGEKYV